MTAGPRLARRTAVLLLLGGGAAALALTAATWLRTTGSSPVQDSVRIAVSGNTAAPGASAAALVVLAGALALGIAGRIARYLVLSVEVVAGAVIAVSALAVTTDPGPDARAAAASRTGVEVIGPVHVEIAAWAVVAAGTAIVLAALAALVLGRGWPSAGGRHETGRHGREQTGGPRGDGRVDGARAGDDRAAWDALSAGHDPTGEGG